MDFVPEWEGAEGITQEKLEQVFSWLRLNYPEILPADYTPSIERYKEPSGSSVSPEEYVYLLFRDPDALNGFREAFLTRVTYRQPSMILSSAKFPAIATRFAISSEQVPDKIERWADEYKGRFTPWLWIRGGTDSKRTGVLAQAAIAAAHAMDRNPAVAGLIRYVGAHDLCQEVNSSNQFGTESKWITLQKYTEVTLLLIDGIGDEHQGERELDALSQLITARWREALPTVMASSIGLAEWIKGYGRAGMQTATVMSGHVVDAMSGWVQANSANEKKLLLRDRIIDLDI